jgi:hypothetical protein
MFVDYFRSSQESIVFKKTGEHTLSESRYFSVHLNSKKQKDILNMRERISVLENLLNFDSTLKEISLSANLLESQKPKQFTHTIQIVPMEGNFLTGVSLKNSEYFSPAFLVNLSTSREKLSFQLVYYGVYEIFFNFPSI